MTTEILGLDELLSSQSSKEVTHNTALRQIEGRLIRALSITDTPPGSPANGDSYIVAASATDAWAGHDGDIAHFYGGGWHFWTPIEGIRLWVNDEDLVYAFDGSGWATHDADAVIAAHEAASDPHPQYLTQDEADALYAALGAGGSVTSVGLTVPSILSVSGSPVTGSGTLAVSLATQAANKVLAGPTSGSAAAPTFRSLVQDDLPAQPLVTVPFYPGVPTASALMLLFAAPAGITTLTFAAALAGSSGKALTAATAQTDFDVRKNATTSANGTSVGTIRFAAAGTVPTFIAASGFTLTGGTDWLTVWAPATPDATLANISASLYCTR